MFEPIAIYPLCKRAHSKTQKLCAPRAEFKMYSCAIFHLYFISSDCATAQQSYYRHARVRRPSVVRSDIVFSYTTELTPNFEDMYLFTTSPHHFFVSVLQNFKIFDFFFTIFFSVFVNIGPYWRKKITRRLL